MTEERLHKFIAACGVTSRRKAEDMIQEGRVRVNGTIVSELGFKITEDDVVEVDGVRLSRPDLFYYLLNKPKGVITSMTDPRRRETVAKYFPDQNVGLKPVGRLDMETEGLLVITNDGDFALKLAHPRYEIEKEYFALVEGTLDEKAIKRLQSGIILDGKKTSAAEVEVLGIDRKTGQSRLKIIIHEGMNRQIRRMCDAVGHPVSSLRRVRIGPIRLHHLAPGMCRVLSKVELDKLRNALEPGSVQAKPKPRYSPKPQTRTDRPAESKPRPAARKPAARPAAGGAKRPAGKARPGAPTDKYPPKPKKYLPTNGRRTRGSKPPKRG